jgi:uncharacterized protein (TIGR03435 family)
MARMQDINDILRIIQSSQSYRDIVVDKTGLTGKYDFTLEYALPQRPDSAAPPLPEALTPAGVPDFITALRQQLGLMLQPKKARLPVLVIDRFNKDPMEN